MAIAVGATISAVDIVPLATGYLPAQYVYFTSGGTFSKASYPWLRAIRVTCVGGGGGGGRALATGAGQASSGDGGGAGGEAVRFITDIAGLAPSVTVTIGAGGTTTTSASNAGGSTSFGSLAVATGGDAGGTLAAGSTIVVNTSSILGGIGTTGDLLIPGEPGQNCSRAATDRAAGGSGGSSRLGAGGPARGSGAGKQDGLAARGYGSGGSGAANAPSQTATAGGAGTPGIVVLELFA